MSHFYGKDDRRKAYYQEKVQDNRQAQTIDQNFANNILFMALSAMETLQHKITNRIKSNGNKDKQQVIRSYDKEFGRYDKHDYSFKEQIEIKGQLRNNVMLLANSKMAFELTYGKGSYQLPKNYNEQMVLIRIANFKNNFKLLKDEVCYYLAEDMEKILSKNQTTGLSYQKMVIQDPYQGKTNNRQFLNGAVIASEQMREEEQKIKNKYGNNMDSKNLQFYSNQLYKNPVQKSSIKTSNNQEQKSYQNRGGYSMPKTNDFYGTKTSKPFNYPQKSYKYY